MTQFDRFQKDVLTEGLEDYVGLWQVARRVRESLRLSEANEVRQAVVDRLRPLFEGGHVEAGELASNGGFSAWKRQGQDAVERIDREWRRLGHDPNISDICWLNNTALGDAVARRLQP